MQEYNKYSWYINYFKNNNVYIKDNIFCVEEDNKLFLFLHDKEYNIPPDYYIQGLIGTIFGYDYDNENLNDEEVLIRRNCRHFISKDDVLFNYTEYMKKLTAINKIKYAWKRYQAAKLIQSAYKNWIYKIKILSNPYTFIGLANLALKAIKDTKIDN